MAPANLETAKSLWREIAKHSSDKKFSLKLADGQYLRILHQVTTIQSDGNGAVLRVLGVHTDITNLKKENGSTLSFIGLNGLPCYDDVNTVLLSNNRPDFTLSKREREVLQHLLHGKTSSQIAASMFISKETVDRHRKNMLKKTHSKSTAGLSVRSIQENWA
jgi:DNA-binding CsgD family transcriptional regulator